MANEGNKISSDIFKANQEAAQKPIDELKSEGGIDDKYLAIIRKYMDDATVIITRQLNSILSFQISAEAYKLGLVTREEFEEILQEQVENYELIDEAIEKWIKKEKEKEGQYADNE